MTSPEPYRSIEAATTAVYTDAFWDMIDRRIDFLDELVRQGHEHEAQTLCLVYLDGVAGSLAPPDSPNGVAFCAALAANESTPFLKLVHPLQARQAARKRNGFWQDIADKLDALFPGPAYALMTKADFLQATAQVLSAKEQSELARDVWIGTVASVVYGWMRNPWVHELVGSTTISFDSTTWQGQAVDSLTLQGLMTVLRRAAERTRAGALTAGRIR